MRNAILCASALLLLAPAAGDDPALSAQPFHSTHALNLPTATTTRDGRFLFEVSHRFRLPVADSENAFFGLDGPISLRLGLGYAITDAVTVTVQRSNLQDNLDLNLKSRLWLRDAGGPWATAVAAQVGTAWNGELPQVAPEPREWQYYALLALNQQVGSSVAVGVVPAWVRDPDLFAPEAENAFSLGVHGQWWMTRGASVVGEWVFSEPWDDRVYDSGALGVELEVRGHFFKLLVTNQTAANPTQFLTGTASPFEPGEWRFGFNITRVLQF